MRAVLESGRLNMDVFGHVRGTDGVLKTPGGSGEGGGLVVGNDLGGAPVTSAAAYVRDNRLGVRKPPEAGGASLDVAGDLACTGDIHMYDAVTGTSFADERVPRLRANSGSLSLGMRGVAGRAYAGARGTLDASMVSSGAFLRPFPVVSRPEDVPRVYLSDVRTRDDTVTNKRRVIVRFGADNDGVAALDHLDRARAGDVLRFGESVYRVSSAKYVHPLEAAGSADAEEGLEVTCEALPEIPYASGPAALPLSYDVGEALKRSAESPSTTPIAVSSLSDATATGLHSLPSFTFPLPPSACDTASLSTSTGTLRVRCKGSSRLMRHVRGGTTFPRPVSLSEGREDILIVSDARPSSGFTDSFDVTLRSASGGHDDMLSAGRDVLTEAAASATSGTDVAARLTGYDRVRATARPEDRLLRLAGLTLKVRSRDATSGVIVFEIADDVYSRALSSILPFSATGGEAASPPVITAISSTGSSHVWLRQARTEAKSSGEEVVVVLETYEPSSTEEASAAEALVQLAGDGTSSIAEELLFKCAGDHEMRVSSTQAATDGMHMCVETAEGGVSPELRSTLLASCSHTSAPHHVLVLSGPSAKVSRPWRVCDVRAAGPSTTSLRLVLKRADGRAVDASDAFEAVPWSDGGVDGIRLRAAVFRKSSHASHDTLPLLTPRGLHVGPDADVSPAPDGVVLSLNGGSDFIVRDGGGVRLEGDAGSEDVWRLFCDEEDRLRLGETELSLRRGGHAEFAGDVKVGGVLTATAFHTPSDARLKSGVRDVDYGPLSASEVIRDLRVRRFEYRDDPHGRTHTGLVAQEAGAVHSRLESRSVGPSSYSSLDLQELLFLMLKGMQELQRDNAELRSFVQKT